MKLSLTSSGLSRIILQLIIWFLVLIWLGSQFSWAGVITHHLYQVPELRIEQADVGRAVHLDNMIRFQCVATVVNRGNAPARELYVHVYVPNGRITRFEFISQEPYTIRDQNLDSGKLGVWLERLTAGAGATLYLWGERSVATSSIEVSAVSEQGASKPQSTPTLSEEIQSIVTTIRQILYDGVSHIVAKERFAYLASRPGIQRLHDTLQSDPGAQSAVAVVVLVIALSLIFLRPAQASLVIGVLVALVTWFFFALSSWLALAFGIGAAVLHLVVTMPER